MGLLSDKERDEFRISISSKPLPKLTELFNKLTADRNDDRLDDHSRGKAAEKAAMVRAEMTIRDLGGFSG